MSTTVKYIHSGTVPMNASEMTKRGKINKNFWYLYGNATRGVDKRAEVTPLSWFSPAVLQNLWNDNVGPMSLKLTKEVHMLDKYRKKLPTVKEANKKDHRIPSSSAPVIYVNRN